MDQFDILAQYCEQIGCPYRVQEPMSHHTTFKIGGPARLFLSPENVETAAAVLRKAHQLELSVRFIGKGSDLLVSDRGISQVVLAFNPDSACMRLEEERIICQSGASLTAVCVFAQKQGLTGLEFAYGIPGSLGGAIFMNAGAYGGEMKDVLEWVEYLDEEGQLHHLQKEKLELSYRRSFFTSHPKFLITAACLQLSKGDKAEILEKMRDLKARRIAKQPLDYPSAGSTFKRQEGNYASALIDQCSLKGLRVGGAMVSEKHAGFVINYDHATCEDVRELIRQIQEKVKEQTGYQLECEVQYLE